MDDKDADTGLDQHSLRVRPTVTFPTFTYTASLTFDVSRGQSIKQRLNTGEITAEELREELSSYLKVRLSGKDAIRLHTLVTTAKWSLERACDKIDWSRFIKQFFEHGL